MHYEKLNKRKIREKEREELTIPCAKQGQQTSTGARREDLLNLHSTRWKENGAKTCSVSAISIQCLGTVISSLLFPTLFNV